MDTVFRRRGLAAYVNTSRFEGKSGVKEYHLTVSPCRKAGFETQLESVNAAYNETLEALRLEPGTAVMRRFFCSNLPKQRPFLEKTRFSRHDDAEFPCSVSWICQPPEYPAKISLWAYHLEDPNGTAGRACGMENTVAFRRGGMTHYRTCGLNLPSDGSTSYEQTRGIFNRYNAFLQEQGMSIGENVIRTWLFVQNIDANYTGMVEARKEFFLEHGLNPKTHFIASTGVEGSHINPSAIVTMDAYAVSGVKPEQVEYLSAPNFLSPTHAYGVTFERGTSVAYNDRKHVIISGTASIDRMGRILHRGNVTRQLCRALNNIGALLARAGATLKDVAVFIVYVKNPEDNAVVREKMIEQFGGIPISAVNAPICRPDWLVEVECIAVIHDSNPNLPPL